jgi:hypothetical protein
MIKAPFRSMVCGLGIILKLLDMTGCTTRAAQHYPFTLVDEKGYRELMIQRIVYPADSSWDKPAVKDTIYQVCPYGNWDPKTDILVKLEECEQEHTHHAGMTYTSRTHDSNGPVLAGAVTTLPIAGAILGGAALVRPSRVTQNNNSSLDIRASTINPPLPTIKK